VLMVLAVPQVLECGAGGANGAEVPGWGSCSWAPHRSSSAPPAPHRSTSGTT